jgi:hypothetical protein
LREVSFDVKNDKEFAVKDLLISCDIRGKSGTKMQEKNVTLYDIFPKKKTKRSSVVTLGFVNEQANTYYCTVESFTIAR